MNFNKTLHHITIDYKLSLLKFTSFSKHFRLKNSITIKENTFYDKVNMTVHLHIYI
jgi:hypothetical protein